MFHGSPELSLDVRRNPKRRPQENAASRNCWCGMPRCGTNRRLKNGGGAGLQRERLRCCCFRATLGRIPPRREKDGYKQCIVAYDCGRKEVVAPAKPAVGPACTSPNWNGERRELSLPRNQLTEPVSAILYAPGALSWHGLSLSCEARTGERPLPNHTKSKLVQYQPIPLNAVCCPRAGICDPCSHLETSDTRCAGN